MFSMFLWDYCLKFTKIHTAIPRDRGTCYRNHLLGSLNLGCERHPGALTRKFSGFGGEASTFCLFVWNFTKACMHFMVHKTPTHFPTQH